MRSGYPLMDDPNTPTSRALSPQRTYTHSVAPQSLGQSLLRRSTGGREPRDVRPANKGVLHSDQATPPSAHAQCILGKRGVSWNPLHQTGGRLLVVGKGGKGRQKAYGLHSAEVPGKKNSATEGFCSTGKAVIRSSGTTSYRIKESFLSSTVEEQQETRKMMRTLDAILDADVLPSRTAECENALVPVDLQNFTVPDKLMEWDQYCKDANIEERIRKGTTTLAFVYQGGIVVAVDSRASMGPYVSSQTVKKIIEINKQLLGTMAGGAADCSFWERVLAQECRVFELRNRRRITVAAASKILAGITYYYKGMFSMGTMITGWDEGRGPQLFYVDSDGTRVRGQRFSVGSGSTYAYGVLDAGYRHDLSKEEALDLGRRAIYHATHRDAYSGGFVRVYHVGPEGWERISLTDTKILHYQYKAERESEDMKE